MKLKYRIKKYTFPTAKYFYISQYKIFGVWMTINDRQFGQFFITPRTYCETFIEAENRISIHKNNILRSKEWYKSKKLSYRNKY